MPNRTKSPLSGDDRDRKDLRTLARTARAGLISLERASGELGISEHKASARLAGLVRRGWLTRVRRGLFLVLPLESEARVSSVVEDPWLLAVELFAPCYIGGWSAAEHWDLTEQLFHSTFVVSAGRVRRTDDRVGGIEFHVVKVSPRQVESVGPIWRGRERVPVSNRERTIADGLVTPAWLGGIRHLAEILGGYRRSTFWSPDRLLAELSRIGTGAAFKRLGFLAETLGLDTPEFVAAARARRTTGNIRLDPTIRGRGRLLKRWGLWVNATVGDGESGA
jgi:predicted transcriptional regulator of viral defense system